MEMNISRNLGIAKTPEKQYLRLKMLPATQ